MLISSSDKDSKTSLAFNSQVPWSNASIPYMLLTKASFSNAQNPRFRAAMEDNCKMINNFMDSPNHNYYAVFDGHAGSFAADWCFENFHKSVAQNLKLFSPSWDFPEIMASAFELADKQMISDAIKADEENINCINNSNNNYNKSSSSRKSNNAKSGCTASVVMITSNPQAFSNVNHKNNNANPTINSKNFSITPQKKSRRSYSSIVSPVSPSLKSVTALTTPMPLTPSSPHHDGFKDTRANCNNIDNDNANGKNASLSPYTRYLYTCNVGDSAIVLCIDGKAKTLSYNHRATDPAECNRISSSTPQTGTFIAGGRVNGILSVTRAIGDKPLKAGVSPRPYTSVTPIDNNAYEFVIIASDGLWDVCSPQQCVNLVRYMEDTKEASAALVRHALQQNSNDNITCMVIRLNPPPPPPPSSPPAPKTNSSTHMFLSSRNLLQVKKRNNKAKIATSPLAEFKNKDLSQTNQRDKDKTIDSNTVFKDTIDITLLPTSSVSENACSAPQQVQKSNPSSSSMRSQNVPVSPPPSFTGELNAGTPNTNSIPQHNSTSNILNHFSHSSPVVTLSANRCTISAGKDFPRNMSLVSPSDSDVIMNMSEDEEFDNARHHSRRTGHMMITDTNTKEGESCDRDSKENSDDDSDDFISSIEDYDEAATSEEDGVFKSDDLIDSLNTASSKSSSSSSSHWNSVTFCSTQAATNSSNLHPTICSQKNNDFHVGKTSPPLMKRPHHRAASFSPSSSESARRSLLIFKANASNYSSSSSTSRFLDANGSSSLLRNSIIMEEASFSEYHSGPNQRTTLDRYGRVKRNMQLDIDMDGSECAIADDEDD